MKKMNAKGFTLIELLAVITIMGILMIVAIPAVTRTIENSRKDTFVNTVQNYVNGAKNMWAADNLSCNNFVSSAVETGYYFIKVDSSSTSVPQLLESGGKSSWGSRDMKGYILVHVEDVTSGTVTTRKVSYYPVIVDGVHGVNVTSSAVLNPASTANFTVSENLKRGNLLMSGAAYSLVLNGTDIATPTWDVTDASGATTTVTATECVEV